MLTFVIGVELDSIMEMYFFHIGGLDFVVSKEILLDKALSNFVTNDNHVVHGSDIG